MTLLIGISAYDAAARTLTTASSLPFLIDVKEAELRKGVSSRAVFVSFRTEFAMMISSFLSLMHYHAPAAAAADDDDDDDAAITIYDALFGDILIAG